MQRFDYVKWSYSALFMVCTRVQKLPNKAGHSNTLLAIQTHSSFEGCVFLKLG